MTYVANVCELLFLAIPAGQVYITELSRSGIGRPDMTLSSPSLNAPALPLIGYHIETGYFTINTGTQRKIDLAMLLYT